MSDPFLLHGLAWKVGTSRGTYCGLSHDSPAMLSLQGKLTPEGHSVYAPFSATMDSARVTCPACIEKLAKATEHAVAGKLGAP